MRDYFEEWHKGRSPELVESKRRIRFWGGRKGLAALGFFFRLKWNQWWRHSNKLLLFLTFLLILFSVLVALDVLLPTIIKGSAGSVYRVGNHILFLAMGAAILLFLSWLSPRHILMVSVFWLLVMLLLLLMVLLFGITSGGATRNLILPYVNLGVQPSILIAPFFCVVISKLLSIWRFEQSHFTLLLTLALSGSAALLIFLQPDLDTAVLIVVYFLVALFFSGVHPVKGVLLPVLGTIMFLVVVAFSVDYTRNRLFLFWAQSSDTVDRYSHAGIARRAVEQGSFFGMEHGKRFIAIPKGHNDLVFASMVEVYGFWGGGLLFLLLLGIFFTVLYSVSKMHNLFATLSSISLLTTLVMPAVIHVLSSLGLFPILGQPLPFLSTGGSGIMASAVALGFILALIRAETLSDKSSHFRAALPARDNQGNK